MKKWALLMWILVALWFFCVPLVYGQGWWGWGWGWGWNNGGLSDYTTNMFNNNNSQTNIGISTIWTTSDQWWNLIQIIKNFINWVLWILSLIALILCLWGWFQIVTAAWDEWKQKKWMSVLKHAAIWLVIIWLAWFVVTIVFWLLRWVTWATSNWDATVTAQQ